MNSTTRNALVAALAAASILVAGCSGGTQAARSTTTPPSTLPQGSDSSASPPPATTPASTNPYPVPTATVTLTGSGSTFVKPLVDSWALGYNNDHPSVRVGYNGGGSGQGISDIKAQLVQFAGSDAPLQAADYPAAAGILQFPDTIGPVAVVYNVDGVPDGLKLTGDLVGKVMVGAITKWNDPAIMALNPGVHLPDASPALVYRSDKSGTTFVFTDYLGKVSPDWAAAMGSAPTKLPDWSKSGGQRVGGQNGNDGVASTVKTTPNSIGYVDLAFVKKLSLDSAAIQNQAGEFQMPTTEGAGKAAVAFADALPGPDGDWSQVSIVNAPAAGAYPVSSFSYILVWKSQTQGRMSSDQQAALKAWLYWDLHEGQGIYPKALGYAPLPASVVAIGENALSMMGP